MPCAAMAGTRLACMRRSHCHGLDAKKKEGKKKGRTATRASFSHSDWLLVSQSGQFCCPVLGLLCRLSTRNNGPLDCRPCAGTSLLRLIITRPLTHPCAVAWASVGSKGQWAGRCVVTTHRASVRPSLTFLRSGPSLTTSRRGRWLLFVDSARAMMLCALTLAAVVWTFM